MTAPVFSADRIALLLQEPGKVALIPTAEQRKIIEYPLRGSALVIAGAGSGKTETMANRVVWLIANGLVSPEQVLGLTFTRKAAGELQDRIMTRLERFALAVSDAAERRALSPGEELRAHALQDLLSDGLHTPDVSTYDSFAAGILQEFGAAAGIAPGATIIDEATAWRIAREIILRSDDPALRTTTLGIGELVRLTIAMDHEIADNHSSPEAVERVVADFSRVLQLPYNDRQDVGPRGAPYAPLQKAVDDISDTPLIARLARAFADEKQRRGLIEFSDQLALATRTVSNHPPAARALRERYGAVLLDEVQDTSFGQTRLLSDLFAGSPVMAVGDPHQSIYGWRGASAEGLESFHRDFCGRRSGATGTEAAGGATLTLSTSWRNPVTVLAAANRIAEPLVSASPIEVPKLSARPSAAEHPLEWRFPETLGEEFTELAAWMAAARAASIEEARRKAEMDAAAHTIHTGEPVHIREEALLPTAAVVFRNRRHMAAVSAALTEAGVPNRIVGLGGLLSTPEITDLVTTLRCVWYAEAGSELIRLLTGPRFRVGIADLAGLRDAARWFAERDVSQQRLSDEDRAADRVLRDPDRAFTLIDTLDEISRMRDHQHAALRAVSAEGFARLQEAGRMLARLRRGLSSDVLELIAATIRELRLDIELEANELRSHDGGAAALANLDAFVDLAAHHLAIDSRGTLQSLLEWVERAQERDEAEEHVPAPVPGTVQLITVHGAKGLEWDLVAVPRLVEEEFPSSTRQGVGWLRRGQFPDELRGDATARPQLNWRIAHTQQELRDRITAYREEAKERHAAEERRLAYVAFTRTGQRLLLTGSFWGGQKRPRTPSRFLTELEEAPALLTGLPTVSHDEHDPSEDTEMTLQWPLDPLGSRGAAVMRAAASVRTQISAGTDGIALPEIVEAVLAERDIERASTAAPELPDRITASSFHEFIADPQRAERNRLRPVPQRPFRRTRTGNRFHEWVERRTTTPQGTALPLPSLEPEGWDAERTEFDGDTDLQPLIDVFERSRWADRAPIAVELEVSLPFAGRTLVCKLDAVYETADNRIEIVDWKAGRPPATATERDLRFFQLDLYRQAYAQWAQRSPDDIDVTLFYVAVNEELTSGTPRSLAELEELWHAAASQL